LPTAECIEVLAAGRRDARFSNDAGVTEAWKSFSTYGVFQGAY
jgi:hypothetical protein